MWGGEFLSMIYLIWMAINRQNVPGHLHLETPVSFNNLSEFTASLWGRNTVLYSDHPWQKWTFGGEWKGCFSNEFQCLITPIFCMIFCVHLKTSQHMKTHFQTTEGRQSLGKSLKISMNHWKMQGTEMFLVKSVAKWEEKWRASISIDSKISLRGGLSCKVVL